ncbi:hypothetical protein P7C73_g2172, partial [Tremellales sp. Uapishka_1]
MSNKKVIIVGAGVGGTSTAARLAHAGLDVEVYEKNSFSGGRCSLIHHDGFRFDQGPSLLLLPPLFHQLYSDLDTTLEEHIELLQCNPNYVIHYHDGEKVILSSDRAQLGAEVEKWEGAGGAEGLEGYLAGGNSRSFILLAGPEQDISHAVVPPATVVHPKRDPATSVRESVWQWYPRGGFHSVVQSLVNIATSHSAKFHFSSPVSSVTYDASGKTTGVVLENGEKREADLVVVNADLVWAHNNLFKKDGGGTGHEEKLLDPHLAKRLLDKPHSCSSISFYWAMDSKIPSLNAHNIFLAEDYKGSFDDIFKRKGMPREPSFYVNVPSRIDASAAPDGKDGIVVLVPVGHLLPSNKDGETIKTFSKGSEVPDLDSQDWPALVERARAQVIESMETRLGITGLRDKILWEEVNTPITWKEKFNLTHGSILGITHDFFNVLAFRQQARHPTLKGAYFVGASAHPGTGVPIAIAGSKLCAEAILSDLDIPFPPSYTASAPVKTTDLDKRHSRSPLYILEDWAPIIIGLVASFSALLFSSASRFALFAAPERETDRGTFSFEAALAVLAVVGLAASGLRVLYPRNRDGATAKKVQ